MVKEKPAVSQIPPTVATVVDIGVLNMGDGKREKVCIVFLMQQLYCFRFIIIFIHQTL